MLVVGCGNSELSEQMYDVGYKRLTNIDISETVVTHMNQRNAERRPGLVFQQVDATQTPYEDASYQAALDKSTLDAMASEEEGALARSMLTEVGGQRLRGADRVFPPRSVRSLCSFLPSAGEPRARRRRALRLRDAGGGERGQAGRGALCAAGLGREAPLPAGGERAPRGLLRAARLRAGVHQVPPADGRAHPGDVPRGGRRPGAPRERRRPADGRARAPGLRRVEEEAAQRHGRRLQPLPQPVPRRDRPPPVHAHGAGLSPGGQGAQIEPVCHFYR